MSILVSANQISKTFGVRPLFEGVTFVVESGERMGLIGPNGAGKSTLLKILAGRESVDAGSVSFQKGLKTGFLEQTPTLSLDLTIEAAIASDTLGPELISKLELSPFIHQKIETLSGGWRKRVALARELAKEPDLLLLDEPTNHLDIESILWLEGFLAKAPFATVVVTHDRLFLQRVATRIVELDKRNLNGLLSVKGDYATYLERKETLMALQEREETVLKNTLRRETEWLRRGPKARQTKQQARINAAGKLEEQVNELETRNQIKTARIDFQSSEKKPKRLIEGKKLSKRYGDRVLFRDLDIFIGPGSRIGLLGTNGCGKSTLIRVLLDQEKADSGQVLQSEHLKVAYFEQNREALNPQTTLRKTLCPYGDNVIYRGTPVHIMGYLDRFLFRKEQADMPIARLSGGEQSRVLIAKLMLKEANVLVLDEPTNDLDVQTLDILQDCLTEFDGAVILVTHDRYFLDQVANLLYAFPTFAADSGQVLSFADLAQWENWRSERGKAEKSLAKNTGTQASQQVKKRKLSFNEARELAGMEDRIHLVESDLKVLETESQKSENQSNAKKLLELYQAIALKQSEIEKLYTRWSELEAI